MGFWQLRAAIYDNVFSATTLFINVVTPVF